MSRLRLATVIFVLACVPRLAEANTGVVIFDNGDRLTGEIKSLKRGLLRFKTDAAGTINIEWDNVAFLSSEQNIQVETAEGLRFLGHLSRSGEEYQVTVETEAGPFSIDAVRVVNMHPIKETITGRADGEVYAGYDFTKATEVKQFNAGFDLDYRTELRNFSLSGDATTSDSSGVDSSQRIDLLFDYTRFRRDRWINTVLLRANRNDQLGVDLRSTIGVGGGRILRQSNSMVFVLEGGLLHLRTGGRAGGRVGTARAPSLAVAAPGAIGCLPPISPGVARSAVHPPEPLSDLLDLAVEQPRAEPAGHPERGDGGDRHDEQIGHEQLEREAAAGHQPTALYPTPRTVAIQRGEAASSPSALRRLRTWTSTTRSSPAQSHPHTCSRS